MLDQDREQASRPATDQHDEHDEWAEAGEEEVPTVVLYVVAGLLVISFTLYLVVGGGHNHFH